MAVYFKILFGKRSEKLAYHRCTVVAIRVLIAKMKVPHKTPTLMMKYRVFLGGDKFGCD